ncbi:MAG TPA: hypothetical protein VHJ18_31500, partial [Streptosporangiaceae bacterium]|nr:hypothetical protein [Streptosporangiaceae bacterium]
DIVYLEQLSGSALYIDDDTETHHYALGFGHLVAESLDQDASRELIARVMRDHWADLTAGHPRPVSEGTVRQNQVGYRAGAG